MLRTRLTAHSTRAVISLPPTEDLSLWLHFIWHLLSIILFFKNAIYYLNIVFIFYKKIFLFLFLSSCFFLNFLGILVWWNLVHPFTLASVSGNDIIFEHDSAREYKQHVTSKKCDQNLHFLQMMRTLDRTPMPNLP